MNKAKSNTKANQRKEESDNESVEEEQNYLNKKQNRDTTKKQRKSSDSEDNDQEEEKGQSSGCKELFLKNLPWKADEDTLKECFGKYGEVTNVKILKDRNTGKPRGIGFLEFSTAEEAQSAMDDAANIELEGRQLTINFSDNKDANRGPKQEGGQRDRNQGSQSSGDGTTIFVGNLGFKTSESSIREFFDDCGTVTSVRIAKGDDGRSKGFCHVDFDSNDSVQKAIEKNGQELDGRAVRVDASTGKRSNDRGDRGGFRGGRGGRGGGRGGFGGGRGNSRGGRGGRGGFRGNRY